MKTDRKTSQLQIRVSKAQKTAIKRQAKRAGMGMSDWVLSMVVPPSSEAYQGLLTELSTSDRPGYVLADLNELLTQLTANEYRRAVSERPRVQLDPYLDNYVAAMLEPAAVVKHTEAPAWTEDVQPLDEPVFGSSLRSLRLHLLRHSPPAFRRRNIFIDSSIGDRV